VSVGKSGNMEEKIKVIFPLILNSGNIGGIIGLKFPLFLI
jgi:hypothetical protein